MKGASAAAQIVKRGGSIIVAAECWDGIPAHGDYGQLLYEANSVESLLDTVRDPSNDCRDKWQAHIQALISQKADLYFHSPNLSDEQIRRALLIPCPTIEGTVKRLLDQYGSEATICVLPEGPQAIPYVQTG
jgi:nickel-dependent lactate racemase